MEEMQGPMQRTGRLRGWPRSSGKASIIAQMIAEVTLLEGFQRRIGQLHSNVLFTSLMVKATTPSITRYLRLLALARLPSLYSRSNGAWDAPCGVTANALARHS